MRSTYGKTVGSAASNFSMRQLRLLQALGDLGQMQRAASHLSMSQPAASKVLAQMEGALGVALFVRKPRGLEPTVFGQLMLHHTRVILSELDTAHTKLQSLREGRGGRVAVGSVMAPVAELLTPAINDLIGSSPDVEISVEVEASDVLVANLLDNVFDFVIARIPAEVAVEKLDYIEIRPEHACLIVRAGHPLGSGPVDIRAAVGFDWVLQQKGSLLRRRVETMLRNDGIPFPARIVETSSFLATISLLANSDAVAPMPIAVADMLTDNGKFSRLYPRDPIVVEPYGLIRRADRELHPVASRLYDLVRQRLPTK